MVSSLTRAVAVSAAAAFLLLTAGCASTNQSPAASGGGTLTIGMGQPFNSFDFDTLSSIDDFQFAKEVIEPLVVPNAKGTDLRPAFAQSYSYDSTGTVLTFKLAKNATFSDGTPATSADVLFSYSVWKKSPNGPLLEAIDSVEAPTADEVVMTLTHPSSALLSVLSWANMGVIKKDFGGLTRDKYFAHPIGTGPFIVSSWSPGGSMVLKKNKHYHGTEPHLSEVHLESIDDPNQRNLQFSSGKLDVVEAVTPDVVSQFDKSTIKTSPAAATTSIYFNTKTGPFADVDLRKAVSMALDRKALVASVYGGQAEVATAMLSPNLPGSVSCTECDYPKQDVAGAKAALAKSGYHGETLTLSVNSTTAKNILAAQAIQPMLAKVGIKIAISPADQSTLYAAAVAGTYEFSIADYNATSPTLNDPLSFYYASDSFWTYIDPAQFLTTATAVDLARTPKELRAAAQSFEKWSYDTMWAAPIVSINSIFAEKSRVHGLPVNPLSLYNLSDVSVTG